MKRLSYVGLLVAGAMGCGDMDIPDDTHSQTDPITGGTLVTANEDPYNAVVKISTAPGVCTATKIGARRFLTAAHCMVGNTAGSTVRMTVALDGALDTTMTITRVDRHASFEVAAFPSGLPSAYDVSVFEVNADTPTVATLTIRSSYVVDNQLGIFVGYGCDETGTNDFRKQWAFARATPNSNLDFRTHNVTADSPTIQSCDGDSGGPYLIRQGAGFGLWEIAGVTSTRLSGSTPLRTFYSRTGNVRQWIAAPGQNVFSTGSQGTFFNFNSKRCMGVDGSSLSAGAHVSQYSCDGRNQPNDNQYWRLQSIGSGFFLFVNTRSGLCLGVDGASTADGARVSQFGCDPTPTTGENQAWRFVHTLGDYYQIRNGKSGKCIGISGGSAANGAAAVQATCSALGSRNNQSWLFSR